MAENKLIETLGEELVDKVIGNLPLKEVLRASLVSKRWNNLIWNHVKPPGLLSLRPSPCLLFSSQIFEKFVERSQLDKSGKVKTLSLEWNDSPDMIKMYIAFARLYRPDALEIRPSSYKHMYREIEVAKGVGTSYPFRFFTSIKLYNVVIPVFLRLQNLKNLTLQDCHLSFDFMSIGDLFIDAPQLRSLNILVRKVMATHCCFYCGFNLNAPLLECLELEGTFYHSYSFTPMPMISEVTLDVNCLARDHCLLHSAKPQEAISMSRILEGISKVKVLNLTMVPLKVIPQLFEISTQNLEFPHLRVLDIEAGPCDTMSLKFLENIVRGSKLLEIIVLRTPSVDSSELHNFCQRLRGIAARDYLQIIVTNEERCKASVILLVFKNKTNPKEEDMETLMALVELKVVYRVLKMSEMGEEQLHWCEVMSKLSFWEGKLQGDSSPVFFPAQCTPFALSILFRTYTMSLEG